jgi:hypothetical protein
LGGHGGQSHKRLHGVTPVQPFVFQDAAYACVRLTPQLVRDLAEILADDVPVALGLEIVFLQRAVFGPAAFSDVPLQAATSNHGIHRNVILQRYPTNPGSDWLPD